MYILYINSFSSTIPIRNVHDLFCVVILADAEIISLDAFVREPNGPVVGVTLIKV